MLTKQQRYTIEQLAMGERKKDVAEKIGVTDRTIYNWCTKDKEFMDALTQATIDVEKAMRVERIRRARAVAGKAIEELEDRLDNEVSRKGIKTRELNNIYKDVIDTMNKELMILEKIMPSETADCLTGVPFSDDGFREGFRELLLRYREDDADSE